MFVLSRFARLVSSLGHVPGRVPPQVGRAAVLPGHLGSRCCVSRLSWRRLRNLWSRSLPRGLPSPRAPAPLALPLSLAQGRSRSSSRLHLDRSAWPHGPFRQELSRGPAGSLGFLLPPLLLLGLCLIPSRPLLGRQVRGVVPQAPLKHDNAGETSTAAGCGAPPNDRCGARL